MVHRSNRPLANEQRAAFHRAKGGTSSPTSSSSVIIWIGSSRVSVSENLEMKLFPPALEHPFASNEPCMTRAPLGQEQYSPPPSYSQHYEIMGSAPVYTRYQTMHWPQKAAAANPSMTRCGKRYSSILQGSLPSSIVFQSGVLPRGEVWCRGR